jgi:MinD-like ATPase involved in chromosome partitioning or flagellar assembly
MSGTGPLILIIEPQREFADETRALLNGSRVIAAHSMAEAAEITETGRVDLAILGPSFGNETGVNGAAELFAADPGLSVVLVAHVLTNRVLRAALRMGFRDVVDTPLTLPKIQAMIGGRGTHLGAPATFTETAPGTVGATPTTGTTGDGSVVAVGFNGDGHVPQVSRPSPAPIGMTATITFNGPAFESPTVTGTEAVSAALEAPVTSFPPPGPAIRPLPEAPDPGSQYAMPPSPLFHEVAPAMPAPTAEPTPASAPGPMVAPAPPPEPHLATPPSIGAAAEPSGFEMDLEPVVAVPPPLGAPPSPPAPLQAPPEPPRDLLAEIDGPDDGTPAEIVGAPSPARPTLRSPSTGSGMVITVMAGKGGSGKTVAATNLAMALNGVLGEDRVVVLDADLQFGDVALLLQLDPARTIVDAAEVIDDLTEPRLDGLLLRHASGLRVLSAPPVPSSSEQVPPKTVVRLMEMLQGMYEYVIVDTAPIFDDALMTVLDHSDEVVLVVDMDLPSVKNAKIALDTLQKSGYPMGRIHLLVNRVNSKARLDLVELERALGMEVAASVPSDRLVPQSVNEGVPAVAMSPRSKVAKAFEALADLFLP